MTNLPSSLWTPIQISAKKDKGKLTFCGFEADSQTSYRWEWECWEKKAHFIGPKQQNGSLSCWKPTASFGIRPAETEWLMEALLHSKRLLLPAHSSSWFVVWSIISCVLLVAVLDKHALCRSRPSKSCVQTNKPGLCYKPSTLCLIFMVQT